MREVTVSAVISAPREDVFDFVNDLAARPSFTDNFMDDYRLARVQPVGVGESANVTRVELTTFSEPATKIDRFKEIGAAGWIRRKTRKSLDRLRMVFEEPDRVELKRATIAGYEPDKAARFGGYAGMD